MKVIVSGGLGNQMFQYALYLALSEKGKDVKLDTSLFNHTKMHNGFELERCFDLNASKVKVTRWGILKLRAYLKYTPKSIVFDDELFYNDQIFTSSCNIFYGWWQSEKYFKHISEKVARSFNFKNIDAENRKLGKEIQSNNSIALHIRQGDYLKNTLYDGVCNEEYYIKAIKKLNQKIGESDDMIFYVFSDDKVFANKFKSKLNIKARLIDLNQGEDSYKDMYLMSQCKHNIIANSSFSWWGAWLNNNSNKIVVAPKRWFRKGPERNYKDIVPESWLKI